jgi:archaellin
MLISIVLIACVVVAIVIAMVAVAVGPTQSGRRPTLTERELAHDVARRAERLRHDVATHETATRLWRLSQSDRRPTNPERS